MITKRVTIDQIEITSSGMIQIRMRKEIMEGALVVTSEYHRTSCDPGTNVQDRMSEVNAHLSTMGWPAVTPEEIDRVREHAAIKWTSALVEAWNARRQK